MERTWHFWTTRAQAPLTHNLCHWSGGWAGFAFQLNHRKQRDLDVQPGVIPSSLMGSTRLCGRLKPPGEGDLHPPVRNNEGLFQQVQQGNEIKTEKEIMTFSSWSFQTIPEVHWRFYCHCLHSLADLTSEFRTVENHLENSWILHYK